MRKLSAVLKRWNNKGKCGSHYPLYDGSAAQCDPDGERPCCSDKSRGECGNTAEHCTCENCTDYRDMEKWRREGKGSFLVGWKLVTVAWKPKLKSNSMLHLLVRCDDNMIKFKNLHQTIH